MLIALVAFLCASPPGAPSAPTLGVEVGGSAHYSIPAWASLDVSLEIPMAEHFSIRAALDGSLIPVSPYWRVGATGAALAHTSFGPLNLSAGPVLALGLGRLIVLDAGPIIAPDIGGGLTGAVAFAVTDTWSVRLATVLPIVAVEQWDRFARPAFLFAPRLSLGVGWLLPQ